jgi:hypothetical protein
MRNSNSSALWISLLIAVAIGLVWQTTLVVPLKTLVVFFHEVSHLLVALATGGEVIEMRIVPQQGGSVLSRGGMPFLILSAGYLGSLLFGVLLFEMADRTKADRVVVGALGLLLGALTLIYMKGTYGILFGLGSAGVLILCAFGLSVAINDIVLRVLGIVSMMYVPLDIWSDTLARPGLLSDAAMLAMIYGGRTWFWGGLWLAISVAVLCFVMWQALKRATKGPL